MLCKLVETRWPAFVWGPPGVGKSAVVRDVATKLDRHVIDIRAALLDPTDIRGIPYVTDGVARWCAPSFLPGPNDGPGLLFFDELTSAPPLVQASLYQLTLDRKVGEYCLPDDWSIVAAGNRSQDASITFRMPAALSNRFVHLDYEVDYDDWRTWATSEGLHPLVVAFISVRRPLLFQMNAHDRSFPSPRSWEMASDTMRKFAEVRDAEDVLIGIVGEAACIEFFAFLRDSRIADIVDAIMKNPGSAPIPNQLDLRFALVSYLASRLREDDALDATCVLLRRFDPEIGLILVRDIARIRPVALARPEVRKFIEKHKGDITL